MFNFEMTNREYLEEIVIANNPVDRMDLIDLDLVDLLDLVVDLRDAIEHLLDTCHCHT